MSLVMILDKLMLYTITFVSGSNNMLLKKVFKIHQRYLNYLLLTAKKKLGVLLN